MLSGVTLPHCYAAIEKIPTWEQLRPPELEALLLEMVISLSAHQDYVAALKFARQGCDLARTREGETSMACAKILRVMSEAQLELGDNAASVGYCAAGMAHHPQAAFPKTVRRDGRLLQQRRLYHQKARSRF